MTLVRLLPPSATIIVIVAAAIASLRFLRLRPPSTKRNSKTDPPFVVLCWKSFEEKALAHSLRSKMEILKTQGEEELEIRILLHSDSDKGLVLTFETQVYMEVLATRQFGRLVIWSPSLPSTHDLVSQNFCELPVGTVCITDIQFKGRTKNVWESPVGCLMFSFTLEMEDGHKLPLLQYVVSLAVTEAIKEACQAKGLPKIDVRIKWPNDLYLNGLKVGGVLCTSTYRSKKFNICVGIGLNLDNEVPTTCLNKVLKEISSSCRLTREDVLAFFFNRFEELFEVFSTQDTRIIDIALTYKEAGRRQILQKYWKSYFLFHFQDFRFWRSYIIRRGFTVSAILLKNPVFHVSSGQKVTIEERHEGRPVEEAVVTIQGLSSSGYLLATDEDNMNYELHPDGNSFDFFKGLVRRKLD